MPEVAVMGKAVKAVFFDLDGSTLGPDQAFTPSFLSLVRRHREKKWVMTTGRGAWSVFGLGLHRNFDADVPHIFDNGALISRIDGGSELKLLLGSGEKCEALAHLSSLSGVDPIFASVYPGEGLVWPAIKDNRNENLRCSDSFEDFALAVRSAEVTKISVKCGMALSFPPGLHVSSQSGSHDVINHGASKGSAMSVVRKLLRIEPEEILFVCDDLNDLSAIHNSDLDGMRIVKVGEKLPSVRAHAHACSVLDAAECLEDMIVSSCS